jgi:hypothetical protein
MSGIRCGLCGLFGDNNRQESQVTFKTATFCLFEVVSFNIAALIFYVVGSGTCRGFSFSFLCLIDFCLGDFFAICQEVFGLVPDPICFDVHFPPPN